MNERNEPAGSSRSSATARETLYLTGAEFLLCCAAEGIERLYSFRAQGSALRCDRKTVIQAAAGLVRRELAVLDQDGFRLLPPLQTMFQTIGRSRATVAAYRQRFDAPYCLLYGHDGQMTAMELGTRKGEICGVSLYRAEELAEWAEDMQIALAQGLDDELLQSVRQDLLDLAEDSPLRRFLQAACCPPWQEEQQIEVPQEVTVMLERRRSGDGALTDRAVLFRQPLFDGLASGSQAGLDIGAYSENGLLRWLRGALAGEEMEA